MQRSAVIPSLLADDAATARLAIASLPARCALVELRADRLDQAAIREIVGTTDRELIVTVRTAQDGGEFDGTEAEREGLLRAALEAGSRFIDVEWGRPIAQLANGEFSSRVVLSHHAERIDETELERRLDAMQASGAARLKCVIRAERLQDNEIVQRQLARRRGLRRWTIFAAGAAGRWSRLMSPLWGGWGSYAALDNESTTAPHQWTVRELLDVYRIDEIGPETGWIALLGSSVSSSSPSPSMHNAGYAAHGIDRRYVALDAEDWPAAAAFVERAGLKGLALTMPFKRVAFERCDEVDSIARACGAVNTVTIREGGWRGWNTDGVAVLELLRAADWRPSERSVLLGSGGSARAIAAALVSAGARPQIFSRRLPTAAPPEGVELSLIDPKVSFDADWLINATPVRDGSLFEADPTLARRGVLEVVYGGAPTVLLERARERGIQRIDGMQMLVRQAELQFELHSARKAPAGLFAGAGQRYLASLG